jgi:hypothetical protein
MLIRPKPVSPSEPVSVRFPADVLQQLDNYCQYLGGASDRSYVIVEAVRHVIARDRRYQGHRAKTGPVDKPPASPRTTTSPEEKKPAASTSPRLPLS